MEASYIIRLHIEHYKELLRLKGIPEDQRQTAIKLLAEAQEQLPFAIEEEAERQRLTGLSLSARREQKRSTKSGF
ncbi:MAG: hypothetical protein ABSC26_13270 [Stellaceae bacterium]|jgi:hypothetical protein